jgi:hypothetical protein
MFTFCICLITQSKDMKVNAICLRFTGDSSVFEMNAMEDAHNLNIANIPKSYKRTKGRGKLSTQHIFEVGSKNLTVFAWDDGDAGSENKHELPPPLADDLYFGNVYVIAQENNKQVDITMDDYEELKDTYFGGFDDIGSQDTWSEEEELSDTDSLNDFIVPG